ncbi:hypothetical protein BRADI_3g40970v3 [Brachypodium distachyon]|uniref:FHA domain-containing protein n=1 Tax=Brachypodium distachyon TaxID=15368 RepID=A0A2K2D2F8_BRADI|nr:hypothetical protein BRADI_3g40970v3 [Brachypodium distachyon]
MAAAPPVLTLTVEKGPREGETRQCRAGAALRVGLVVSGNDLAVRDAGTSQRHLAIEFLPPPPAARWAVSDLGSSNGTLLNGAPLVPSVPAPLSHGDLISLGESTVLAVSIASDSDMNPAGPRRSSRLAAAGVAAEERPIPAVTRRSKQKNAVAAEPPEAVKEEIEEAAEVMQHGRRKKIVKPPEPEKEKEEVVVVPTRRVRTVKFAEPEKEVEGKEEAAVTFHARRKNKAVTVAPPELLPKTRSKRGRGRVTTASARNTILEEEDQVEQEESEVAAAREQAGNQTATNGDDADKGGKVAAGYEAVEGTSMTLEEEVRVARRGRARRALKGMTNAQCAASDDRGEEIKCAGDVEEDGKREVVGSGGEVGDMEKEEEHAGRSSLETMTLGHWFDRMEKYLPRIINEAADEMIATMEERLIAC